jgi:hypothetical protein
MSVSNFFTHLQTAEVDPVALFLSFEVTIAILFFLVAGGCVVLWREKHVVDRAGVPLYDDDQPATPYIL